MTTVIKRKVKIKWKNLLSFLLFIALLLFGLIELTVCIVKVLTPKPVKEKQITAKKVNKNKDNKLDKLDNIQKEIDYFNNDFLDRYIAYKEKNTEVPNKQIIKNVNMNLDLTHYEDKIKARNLNTEKILVNKYYYLEENYVPDNLETISNRYALFESNNSFIFLQDLNSIKKKTRDIIAP